MELNILRVILLAIVGATLCTIIAIGIDTSSDASKPSIPNTSSIDRAKKRKEWQERENVMFGEEAHKK